MLRSLMYRIYLRPILHSVAALVPDQKYITCVMLLLRTLKSLVKLTSLGPRILCSDRADPSWVHQGVLQGRSMKPVLVKLRNMIDGRYASLHPLSLEKHET